MIVLVTVGEGCGAASRYNIDKVEKGDGAFLCSTVARIDDPFQIGREFDVISALRPRVKKSIVHLVIAISPNDAEKGTAFNFKLWLFELQKRLALSGNQMISWQHFDTAHPHVHVLLNRVRPDGTVVSLWRRGLVIKQFCLEMQHQFGLAVTSRVDVKKEFVPPVEATNLSL